MFIIKYWLITSYLRSAGNISTYLYIFAIQKIHNMEFKELTPESLEKAANMLKAIAHPMRLSIVGCLEDGKKRTVTEFFKGKNQKPQVWRCNYY